MRRLLFFTVICLNSLLTSLTLGAGVKEEDPIDSVCFKGVNLSFMEVFFKKDCIVAAVDRFRASPPLFRLPAVPRSVDHKDYLHAICQSLPCARSLKLRRSGRIVFDMGAGEGIEARNIIRTTYEYLFKLRLYGFDSLIPSVVDYIKEYSSLPSSNWLCQTYDEKKASSS